MADAAGNAMHTTGEESLRALLHEHDLLGYAEKMIDYGTDSANRLLKIGRADFDAMADSVSMKPGHVADMLSVIRTKRPVGCDPIDAGPPINTPTASQSRAKRPKTNSTPVVLVGEVGKQSLVRERLLLAELRQVGDVRKLKV
jgi:hypothetical protein